MNFSTRTSWPRDLNRLAALFESRLKSGKVIYDLTVSNPTECGIIYPEQEILSSLTNPRILQYKPDPRGLLSARKAIADYYKQKNILVSPESIFLTSGTSEAYSLILKLLCNTGESILVPKPSYPLFEYLTQINDVAVQHYSLSYDHQWQIDLGSLKSAITSSTKAIVLVHPHNPTGTFVKRDEFEEIGRIARERDLAVIVDEVFIDYAFEKNQASIASNSMESDAPLSFTLNGLSKMAGLPQMKIGWIVVGGDMSAQKEAVERLEILCDTFLSVNTPAQAALSKLINAGTIVRQKIQERVKTNYASLGKLLPGDNLVSLLHSEGGWSAVLSVPRVKSDEEWAMELLEKKGVNLYPGYFFDFIEGGRLVLSLLPEERIFINAINEVISYITSSV